MPKSALGAQMYTLRDHLKTPLEMAKTCRRVKQMGYDAVQVSAFGPIEVRELAKILDGEGLECAATHVSLDMIKDTAKCVDHHAALKCQHPCIGGFAPPEHTLAAYEQFARDFKQAGLALARQGLSGAGYHNHSRELAPIGPKRILDTLIDATKPSGGEPATAVWFEIDTYWIAHGGGDPAAWIDKVAGRIPCVHFKDMAVNTKQEQKMCEVGDGNLNWPRILDACRRAGVQWYLIERDSGDLDPFDSLQISLHNLRAMGLH
jgi:sugar phosphate isomerase/epimerase